MESMVERMAKALSESGGSNISGAMADLHWDDLLPTAQQNYRHMARAAIEAMREQTDEILDPTKGLV